MSRREIVLHHSRASRAFTALWMLEELALPYRLVDQDIRSAVPSLQIGDVAVTEAAAICIYLADRFSYGTLAPYIEDPDRGPWLKWLVFAAATFEPAIALAGATVDYGASGPPVWGLGCRGHLDVVRMLVQALPTGGWLVGGRFTAADVMLGSAIALRLQVGELPREPALIAYAERLQQRPAFGRAAALSWGQPADA